MLMGWNKRKRNVVCAWIYTHVTRFHTLVEVMSSERVRLYQWENLEHYKWIQEKYDNRPRLHFHLFQNIFVARNIIFRNSILMYESRSFALRVIHLYTNNYYMPNFIFILYRLLEKNNLWLFFTKGRGLNGTCIQ